MAFTYLQNYFPIYDKYKFQNRAFLEKNTILNGQNENKNLEMLADSDLRYIFASK